MGHTVLLSNAQKCPRCPKSSQQRTFPFSLLINKYSSCCFNALLRSITMIEQKDDYGIGWNAECGLCVQVYREQALLTSAHPQPCPRFCRVATQPRVSCFQNMETLDAAYKHRRETKLALVRLGQDWSGLVRWWKVRSLQPAPSCVNSH